MEEEARDVTMVQVKKINFICKYIRLAGEYDDKSDEFVEDGEREFKRLMVDLKDDKSPLDKLKILEHVFKTIPKEYCSLYIKLAGKIALIYEEHASVI